MLVLRETIGWWRSGDSPLRPNCPVKRSSRTGSCTLPIRNSNRTVPSLSSLSIETAIDVNSPSKSRCGLRSEERPAREEHGRRERKGVRDSVQAAERRGMVRRYSRCSGQQECG